MYADKDSEYKISVMELTPEQAFILIDALVRYSTNPDISVSNRSIAKMIAVEISNNGLNDSEYGDSVFN